MVKKSDTETSATVARKGKAKQEDLPTITPSDRKIQELEDLGDALADLQDEASAIREKVKDADENLVAAMKRRERTYYNRSTWGSITLKETKVSCAVKKATATTGGGDSEEVE
jgi:hypothetical protein